jgi:hypothetical protein
VLVHVGEIPGMEGVLIVHRRQSSLKRDHRSSVRESGERILP